MENTAVHPVVLNFADTSVEKAFIQEYDSDNRIFFRIGIYLSCFAWFIFYSGIYFSHQAIFTKALIILISVLLVPFIIVVSLSFSKKYSTLNHHITAYCNFAAACVCIYVAIYLSKDITFLCAGVVCINFFCYFILRIRFKVSLAVTFSYSMIAQYCVLSSGNFSKSQIYTSSSGIWLGFFVAMIAGYFFEKTNRKIFVQNKLLEEQYAERDRTRARELTQAKEIEKAYNELKSTQAQLIQSEKMASLGELTAGIAHEIQNPLNFVNNFSEVNKELLTEMKDEIDKGNLAEVKTIANDVIENQEKINHHGKRADAIVKGMLQHSRVSSGQKEPTDLNALADEYLRLAYHGLRAKDKLFNAKIETDFDNNIGKINVVRQDIGRVMLNLINNAFYATNEKQKRNLSGYNPTVTLSTRKNNGKVEIKVSDNGNGISQKVLDKIFQPFFTTKPTGQGTGLGLSLAYDIVNAQGGEIKVKTKEGEGSEFIIELSLS